MTRSSPGWTGWRRKGENLVLPPELDFMAEKLGAVKDELERSAAAEREAERRKNDLVLYPAHDIKTPSPRSSAI